MGNEAIEGSKMGSQLIMFVAIVGLALVAFLVGKNLMNNGLEQMENTVQSVNDSRFSDYNGKTVRGRAVKSAIDTFANDNVAIFVHTLNMGTDPDTLLASELLGAHAAWSNSVNTNNAGSTPNGYAQVWSISDLSVDLNDGTSSDGEPIPFVNYGAMLQVANPAGVAGKFNFDGKVTFSADFATTESGNVRCNADTSCLTIQGMSEYIADSAQFNAQLVKNTAGETIGIIFYQKKTF